jgi:hypothetical protein
MNGYRYIIPVFIGLAAASVAPAQFVPPATLQTPVPAFQPPPAAQVLVSPQPCPVVFVQPNQPPPPPPNAGILFGFQLGIDRPSLGGYLAGGPLNVEIPLDVMLGYQFPSGRALLFDYRYFGANADRTTQFPGDPGPVVTHRHIEGQDFDFDVRFLEGGWELLKTQTEIGLMATNISYRAFRPSENYPSLVVNRFEGAGPHLNYKLVVPIYRTGFEFFVLSDGGFLWGRNYGFSQNPSPPYIGPRVNYPNNGNTTLLTERLQLAGSYRFNLRYSRVTLTGGYEIDGYLFPNGGEYVGYGGGPLGLFPFRYQPGYVTLANQGPFVRMEVKY